MTILDGKPYINEVRQLIIEYTGQLGRDLTFQNIDEELADPAAKYTAPEGELLVAVEGDEVIGMVAYHRHSTERCEMKRLYVKEQFRGQTVGKQLVYHIITHARSAGYREMVLDTILPLKEAISLYKKFGFDECEPYYNNPMDDVIYMMKKL